MRLTRSILSIAAAGLLAGCAIPVVKYPAYRTPPTVSVSSATLGALTQVPAGDHVLPDSQVSIGGRNAPGADAAVGLLGAIGALVVASTDQSNHASAVGDARSGAPFRFHGPVTAALRIATTDAQGNRVATVLEPDAQADIRVTPRVRLILDDTDAARAFIEMSARFKDAETGADRAKWYSFTDPVTRPLRSDGTGWFDNDAQALRRTTDESFRRLARLMADDLSGRWATLQGSETAPRLGVRSRFTQQEATLIVLETLPTGWIVSPLLQDTQPMWHMLILVDRATVDVLDAPR